MYRKAAELIKNAKRVTVFTGAGISVESGIPAFRGKGGLWEQYDPIVADISFFMENPLDVWKLIKEFFYGSSGEVKPNKAHYIVAEMEKLGFVKTVITQNIDNLHQESGSRNVIEYHGTMKNLVCIECGKKQRAEDVDLMKLPPKCECGGILKPDCVFFGETIPEDASMRALIEADKSDLFIIIGTTGKVTPANYIPDVAKEEGAHFIEVNIERSTYTSSLTDIFLQGKATEVMEELMKYF